MLLYSVGLRKYDGADVFFRGSPDEDDFRSWLIVRMCDHVLKNTHVKMIVTAFD